jgi:hypothetical protein
MRVLVTTHPVDPAEEPRMDRIAELVTLMNDVDRRRADLRVTSGKAADDAAIARGARAARRSFWPLNLPASTVAPDYRERDAALCAEYNRYAAEYNGLMRAAERNRQAARNAAAAARTRDAACGVCFAVHAGTCY